MTKIKTITAREILDSRGNPTIETKVILDNGVWAKASVPAGASVGVHEAQELRDGHVFTSSAWERNRYGGLGVLAAVKNVAQKIAPRLAGVEITDQVKIDEIMIKLDGTANKSNLGANAILSVSLASARAGALSQGDELYHYLNKNYQLGIKKYKLPAPCFNIFNGGKHADTNLDFQEFMIVPFTNKARMGANGRESNQRKSEKREFAEKVRMGAEIFHELGWVLKQAGYDTDVGNEGGYAPDIISSIQAIELILTAIIKAGYEPGRDVWLGMDVGSSQIYNNLTGQYIFKLDKALFSAVTLVGLYHEWLRKYPFLFIEDGLAEDDWSGWRQLTKDLGGKIMLIGDDLFATNLSRLRRGLKERVANAVIIKPNQVGTLTETIDFVRLAKRHNYSTVISHRSGETTDDFIADLAVAVGADYIKAGSLSRGERVAKYNRLMEIESQLIG